MSDTPKHLAAIVAEMRKAVVPMICGRPKIEAVSIRDVLQWADHIEANAAALREALDVLERLDYAIPYVYGTRSPQNEIARLVRMAENKVGTALGGVAQ